MANRNDLAGIVGPVYDTATVATLLGIPADAVPTARAAGWLLGMQTSDDIWVHPVFQFTGRTVDPRLAPAIHALRDAPRWSAAAWFTLPNPDLDGLTPLAWILAGNPPETVTRSARHTAGEWAA